MPVSYKSCWIAFAIVITLPSLCRAAPADPYAQFYDTMIDSVQQDCSISGTAETAQMRQMRGSLNPHQIADLSAQYRARCISSGFELAEMIYNSLHSGVFTRTKLKACLNLLQKNDPRFMGDSQVLALIQCMRTD